MGKDGQTILFNLDTATAEELAKYCVDTAALYQGKNPEIFWGDKYHAQIENSTKFINQIGLDEAKKRAKAKRLNLPIF